MTNSEKKELANKINNLRPSHGNQQCLCPSGCEKAAISSHTIPKSKLSLISDDKKELYKFKLSIGYQDFGLNGELQKITTRHASTFSGFCASHDHSLFNPIEDNLKFRIDKDEHLFLFLYRTLLWEFCVKKHSIENSKNLLKESIKTNESYEMYENEKKYFDFTLKNRLEIEDIYKKNNFSSIRHYVVKFSGLTPIAYSGFASFDFDLVTNKYYQDHLTPQKAMTTESATAAINLWPWDKNHSLFVMSWFRSFKTLTKIATNLNNIRDSSLLFSYLLHYGLFSCENLYISPTWLEKKPKQLKLYLEKILGECGAKPGCEYEYKKLCDNHKVIYSNLTK